MGDGKVEKAELHDFAREVGKRMADLNGRSHSLALMLDCMVAVLDNQSELSTAKFSELLTAELDRRKKAVEAHAKEQAEKAKAEKTEPAPLISVPPDSLPIDPARFTCSKEICDRCKECIHCRIDAPCPADARGHIYGGIVVSRP